MTINEYSENVKKKRKSLGLTQKSFGNAANITRQTVYELESGRRNPTPTVQLKLWKTYGITPMNEVKENTIAYRVKTKRIEMKLTQKELASKVYVSCNTISRIEQGKEIPKLFTVICMAAALNCTLEYLACMDTGMTRLIGCDLSQGGDFCS